MMGTNEVVSAPDFRKVVYYVAVWAVIFAHIVQRCEDSQ
jgi:hypothetical protein